MTQPVSSLQPGLDAADLLRRAAPDIAHELNNLRAIVQGNLRLARQDAKTWGYEGLAEPLADVDMAFQLMVVQVQGVLALAREAPARAPSPQPLLTVLRKVEALVRWALPPQFSIVMPPQSPDIMVLADPELLQAVLLRLVLLAKDAAPGGGEVRISVKNTAGAVNSPQPGSRHAHVCVGIPGNLPEAGNTETWPAQGKLTIRFEMALALARRASAPAGDVRHGNQPEGRGFVCLLLPSADS